MGHLSLDPKTASPPPARTGVRPAPAAQPPYRSARPAQRTPAPRIHRKPENDKCRFQSPDVGVVYSRCTPRPPAHHARPKGKDSVLCGCVFPGLRQHAAQKTLDRMVCLERARAHASPTSPMNCRHVHVNIPSGGFPRKMLYLQHRAAPVSGCGHLQPLASDGVTVSPDRNAPHPSRRFSTTGGQ